MKIKLRLLFGILLFSATLTSCTKDSNEPEIHYTVTFNADGGTPTPQPQKVKTGETATAPASPTKQNYVFLFWHLSGSTTAYNFSTPVMSNITLQAKWEDASLAEYWQVTWELNGGAWATGDNHATQVVKGGTLAEPTAPTKAGKVFDGWYKEAALINKINFPYNVSTITENFALYAKWVDPTAEYWNITWELSGGVWPSTEDNHMNKVEKGTTLSEPVAPVKDGSSFDGWYKEAALTNKVTFPATITSDFKLYAKWGSDPSSRGEGLYIGESMTPVDLSFVTKVDNIVRKALYYIYDQPIGNNYTLILEKDIQMTQLDEYNGTVILAKEGAVLTVIGKGRNVSITGPDNSGVLGCSEATLILEKNITLKGKCQGISAGGTKTTVIMREGCSLQVSGHSSAVDIRSEANFIMEGGTITGNVSPERGGGVLIQTKGVFTMKGGSISGNYAGSGGGVHVSNATFIMEGGWIGNNQALKSGDSALGISITSGSGNGGGVSVDSGGKLIMRGGTIYGSNSAITPNKAKANGDCYYFVRGSLVLKTAGGEWSVSLTNEGDNRTL